jgi:GTPase SAR1 family protein/S1-C subfamily serine protease
MLEGLLELQELNMYGNKVSVIVVPHNPMLLARLEILNLGYNDLAYLPEELDRLKALKTLKVMNNFLEKIPMRVCNMELKTIDVSSNPVIQPPIETCERGIGSMKRYYHCLSMEEQSKPNALEALQSKAARHSRKQAKSKKVGGVGLSLHFSKPKRRMQVSLGRRHSDDSSQSSASKSTPQKLQSSPSSQNRRPIVPDKPSTIAPLIGDDYPKSKSFSTNSDYRASIAMHDPSVSKLPKRSQSLQDPVIEKASTSTRYSPEQNSFTVSSRSELVQEIEPSNVVDDTGRVTINDTLKVIFVGMAMAGKTSMIKRLIEGEDAVIPKRDERTIGVDIYEWDPAIDKRYEHIDNRIQLQDKELEELSGNTNVKFSVWDFAGQHVYHATHELFFSPRALYILVWDMGATNPATKQRIKNADNSLNDHYGAFKLGYDSDNGSSDSDDDDFICEEEARRADRALERDIDEKVQFWVDCIQSSVPGAAILPVASFDDLFEENDHHEAKRRCGILKKRLLKHEARRIQGIKDRLKEYVEQNRANDAPALRLRKLLGSYTRPKIIFGNDGEDSVVRVSGTKYTGFAQLTEKINNIATGRDTAKYRYPIFRGHVGARIPRMRLKVLDAVRRMRDRFKVVEWGYFLEELRKYDITCAENVSDALHFLTNIGELSYFGDVLPDRAQHNLTVQLEKPNTTRLYDAADDSEVLTDDEDDDDVDVTPNDSLFGMNSTVLTVENSSISTDDHLSGGLSQFVFLNPRWLVAAVACILRHDLDREIQETRRTLAVQQQAVRSNSFYEANMNCPVITAEDACMLWQAKRFTKKAAQRAEEYSNEMKLKPFEFLQLLLVRFRVFIPIDLGIEKAFLGGKEYSLQSLDESQTPDVITIGGSASDDKDSFLSTYFFLPSLLGPGEPTEAWTYKSTDSWKATLCHSILFPDGVPPGLMERITASVLSDLYAMAQTKDSGAEPRQLSYEGNITVKEVLCWRTAFIVKLGMQVQSSNGEQKESIVEIFTALVDRDSNVCVGSDQMSVGSMRLVLSGKGQEGDGARKIWMGGYWVVVKAAQRVMEEYGGLEFEKQGFCPECLSKKGVSEASCWDFNFIRRRVLKGDLTIRCRHGHKVDVRLVCPYSSLNRTKSSDTQKGGDIQTEPVVPINDILRSVVVVGLWDGKTRKVVRVGSGFIADKKRGLIVTASHTLMNIWGEKSTPFGENYYGMRQGKVVIGIIPRKKGEESGTEAVFRYFAKIVAKDPEIDQGTCHLDACVLRITTRMGNDIGGTGEGCGDQIEHLLLNNPHAIKQEKLQQLKITDKCELDEQVRIVGYNQGGEGLMGPGVNLNRYVDFARGYVCKKFAGGEVSNNDGNGQQQQPVRHRFKPREEIVIICPTIGGHSGGPCINQQGEVIGILSRADPAENQRCYLVPTYEWRSLLRRAKKIL